MATRFLSYEDARAVIESTPKTVLTLPAYHGSMSDLNYLRQYVVNNASKFYHVSASVFDTATIYSTTLLRDFIHRAIYDNHSTFNYSDMVAQGKAPTMEHDVAAGLRYPAYDACGLMGWQLHTVYDALGYHSVRLASNTDSTYSVGHVLTEVFLQDYGKFALQDATYNEMFFNSSGVPLSYDELRRAEYLDHIGVNASFVSSYVNFQTYHAAIADLSPDVAALIDDFSTGPWCSVPYSWLTTETNTWALVPGYLDRAPAASRLFSTQSEAVSAVLAQASKGWEGAAAALRSAHSVTGFETYSPDSGYITGQWLTVGLKSGTFLSIDLMSHRVLIGRFDQLLSEIAGTGAIHNAKADLSSLLDPVTLLGPTGQTAHDWEAEGLQGLVTVAGTAGSDSLHATGGTDVLVGFGGNDFYYINNASDFALEGAGGGTDRIFTSVSYTLSPNTQVEYLETNSQAGTADINLTGNKFNNVLVGNSGDNMLNGGLGVDKMFGGRGNDTYFVDNAHDTVNELRGQGYDQVYSSVSYKVASTSAVEFLAVTDSTTTNIVNLTGNKYNNTLIGNDGNNTLNGGAGYDVMKGLGGNDAYIVDSSHDKVIEAVGDGLSDTVFASVSYKLSAGSGIDVLRAVAGSNPINLTGNEYSNWVVGNAGSNTLNGGGGNDTLVGGGGHDIMNGGAGADNFVFKSLVDGANNVATVQDFNVSEDHFWLYHNVFIALTTTTGTLDTSEFQEGAASGINAQIVYDNTNGNLYYDDDGTNSHAHVLFAKLAAGLSLTNSHFLIV